MRRILLSVVLLTAFFHNTTAQIVGTNAFLQGHWLEVGMQGNGSFGTSTSPAGYHPHPGFTSTALAMVYDYGYNGWTVGAPAYMGDYTYPGFPQEGWAIEVNGAMSQAYQGSGTGYTGGGLTGSIVSYSNSGGRIIANWQGTASGGNLQIKQETRVDTNASWVVVTARFYNLTGSPINNVYYMRTCDPDNDQSWPGGSFTTTNSITYQNDVDHRVLASAVGPSGAYTYMGLGTKDCRAKAFYCPGLTPSNDLVGIYNGTLGAGYGYAGSNTADQGYGLVYKLGNIAGFDSTVISYAYMFNSSARIDSAFPEPTLVVNSVPIAPSGAAPAPTIDTFDACSVPSMTSLPVKIMYADDKCWTWSTWTWAPATGLAATTGVNNTVDLNAIPSVITYTITGTDSAQNMFSCNHRVMYLTVKNCHSALNNSPCEGDTLKWNMKGDSVGATYVWYGPAPSTTVFSTLQAPFKYPAVLSDSGWYYVIKTIGGVHDTDSTYVTIHPKPIVSPVNNSPLCSGIVDTLLLNDVSAAAGETYAWTGPSGFTSTQQSPSVPGFNSSYAGIYSLTVTSSFGCKRTSTTTATIVPPPPAPVISGPLTYCYGVPFVPFSVAGTNIKWYTSDTGTIYTTTYPTVNTSVPGTYTFYATQTVGCESPKDSITVTVYPQIVPAFTDAVNLGCTFDTVAFTNSSTVATSYAWDFGDGTGISTSANPVHVYTSQGVYTVKLTGYYATCSRFVTATVDTRHTITAAFSTAADTVCLNQSTIFFNNSTATVGSGAGVVTGAFWNYGDGSPTDITNAPTHTYANAGIYNVTLTAQDSIGCLNSITRQEFVLQPTIHALTDTTVCLTSPLQLVNYETLVPAIDLHNYTYQWTPADSLTSDTAYQPFFHALGIYTYTLTATLQPYGCVATHVMTINSILPLQLMNVSPDATIAYGTSIQLNADSEVYYTWVPNDGSLSNPSINNPVATPTITTTYTVYGMDMYGCRDTAWVTIHVDTTTDEFIPSAFTPNGDGRNDQFRPFGMKFQKLVEFRVYNRWGQQIFSTSDREKGWDGTFNGEPQDMGVYYYQIIVARNGYEQNTVYKGEVTLIR